MANQRKSFGVVLELRENVIEFLKTVKSMKSGEFVGYCTDMNKMITVAYFGGN